MKRIAVAALIFSLVVSCIICTACTTPPVEFCVAIEDSRYFNVIGDKMQNIRVGGEVIFTLEFKEGYSYKSNDAGAEFSDGKLTMRNVRANRMIVVSAKENEDIGESYMEIMTDNGRTTYSAYPSKGYRFAGWRNEVGEIYSYANFLTLDADVTLSAYFIAEASAQFINYHVNGGSVIQSPAQSVTHAFRRDGVYLYAASLSAWFFKTFNRDGYVPLEYNTKPDGSGQAFSLGSRVLSDEKEVDLYVIWAKENDIGDFSYIEDDVGVNLTDYKGKNRQIVIPSAISGLPVTRIAAGCFEGSDIQSIVLTRFLNTVEKNAFKDCSQLDTVYMCDSLQYIYDESFNGCSRLKNLRMIAVMAPTYTNDLLGSMVRRIELLYSERNSEKPNLLFYGGSGIFNSIDGQTLYNELGGNFRIINGAQNVNISGPLMLDVYSGYIRPKDVMVYAAEYYHKIFTNVLEMPSWIAMEAFYDGWRGIDIRNYRNVFSAFSDMQTGTRQYSFAGRLAMRPLSYLDYNNQLDSFFTRNYSAEAIEDIHLVTVTIDFSELRNLLYHFNNTYSEKYGSQGKTVYYSFAAASERIFGNSDMALANFDAYLQDNVGCAIVSSRQNHIFSSEYIYDDFTHLTSEGARINSKIYAEHIRNQLISDGKWPVG